jgi:putative ABC transport system permease protein
MSKPADWWRKLLHWGRKSADDRELAEEMNQHLEMKIAANLRAGISPQQAPYVAQREFGNRTRLHEESRELWSWGFIESNFTDLRFAARSLRKNPGFTAVAILTLALGIGANTAIFSVVNSALLRPLAYADPQQLYLVQEIVPQIGKMDLGANLPDYRIWQQQVHSFADVAIAESTTATLTGMGEAQVIHGVRASANILDVLGARPAAGRTFRREEDERDRGHVVMITDSYWHNRFGSDPSVIGQSLTLDGIPHTVIGILPPTFSFPSALGGANNGSRLAFFQPLSGPKSYENDLIGEFDFSAVARLKPSVTPEQALAELNLVQSQIAKQAAKQEDAHVDLLAELSPLEAEIVGPARSGLIFLLAAVGAVLLIVCINLASLLLARVPGRLHEAAIRTSLGATRGRIVRQMLAETFLLSVAGGGAGFWISDFAIQWFVHIAPSSIPRLDEVHMDTRVLVFALVLSIVTGTLFGLMPALRVARSSPLDALKSSGAATTENRQTRRLRGTLAGFEVGLTTILLIIAGLLIASLEQLLHVHTGFGVENVLVASVDLPPQSYSQAVTRLHFYDRVLADMQSLPGVRAAGWVSIPPLAGQGAVTGIRLPGERTPRGEIPIANYRSVSLEYFSAMGIPILKGRGFGPADNGRKVVVISESVAQLFWHGKNPIGQVVTQWGDDVLSEVIGVAGDIRTVSLDKPPLMMVYVPSWFNEFSIPGSASFILKTATDPANLSSTVRESIRKIDPDVPVTSLSPMTEIVSRSVEARRFPMLLALSFALSSLLLASLGIFGVVGYSVEQRRKEIGIRMALGAEPRNLMFMVIRQGMAPVTAGLGLGVVAAILMGRLVNSLLFGVNAFDPLIISGVALVVTSVALLACYFPARRALHVEPLVALRHE